jgi:chitodextrinase
MKKIKLFLSLLLISSISWSQNYSVDICVDLGPIPPGMPPGDIMIYYSNAGTSSTIQGVTDTLGWYCTTISVTPDSGNFAFVDLAIYQTNCNSAVGDTFYFATNTDTLIQYVTSYCGNSNPPPSSGCSAIFTTIQDTLNPNVYYLTSYASGATPYSYQWTFSDGSVATTQNAVYTVPNSNGWNWACLDVTDATGCVASYCDVLLDSGTIGNSSCYADFFAYYDDFGAPGTVMFTNLSQPSGTGNIIQVNWDFGDGTTSSDPAPVHVYQQTAVYPVCLTITDDNGCTSTYCESFCVDLGWWNNNPWNWFDSTCTAYFEVYQDSGANNFFYFIDFSLGNSLYYTWDFGNGTVINDPFPFVTLSAPGTYNVCLTITDTLSGCQDVYCDTLVLDSQGNVQKAGTTVYAAVVGTAKPASLVASSKDLKKEALSSVIVYPNPANDYIFVNAESNENLRVDIYDIEGRLLNTEIVRGGNQKIDVQNLPEGLYLVKVSNNQMNKVFKLSKMK